ncbi:hypothetical protein NS365_23270 [Aureimonas ureilytica]|uniref:Uncharacterized protein n=1 Tax=Aureimonas ureilytica TaxID=401562 RepID=A0A175RE11_9HYPH|nr:MULTISPECIES: hypothetical protein [Aureimonas]KTQ95679.1 hypothetical protein NS226_09640 [Aureimonas ureilytica]KTQ97550.1 hypothetical protein NS365_23270 [Aureimonas ureilytica]
MSRRLSLVLVLAVLVAGSGYYAYRWFTPDSAADLARVGQCERYREAMSRVEAGLESEIQADPNEIQMVLDECQKQGH